MKLLQRIFPTAAWFGFDSHIDLSIFPLISYSNNFSFSRLNMGVDNIRYDVRLSPNFCRSLSKVIEQLVAKHSQTEVFLKMDKTSLIKDRDEFKALCREVLLDGINRSKAKHEIHIDYLAQASVIKQIYDEMNNQYHLLLEQLKQTVRKFEVSHNTEDALRLKKEITRIQQEKKQIFQDSGYEILEYFREVQVKDVAEMREINFGQNSNLPEEFLYNTLLFYDHPFDDLFLMNEYDILLGRRIEDPDKYEMLISQIKEFLMKVVTEENREELSESALMSECSEQIDGWLMDTVNVDMLFNFFQTAYRIRQLKNKKENISEQAILKQQAAVQKKLFKKLYKNFRKSGLAERIIAIYEMEQIYSHYCPPLVPQLIVQYLISSRIRKSVEMRLKRLENFYGKPFDLKHLRKSSRRIRIINSRTRYLYFIRFMKGFIRYHRDMKNFMVMKDAIESINLTSEQRIIKLSRANNCLYEFLLSYERVAEEKPIITHVIIKADIRGSTDITHRMLEKGLNPASYFSLNLFDPITEILPEFGAEKVFVEGDAIILSVFEREDTPEGWYGVARSCGLALEILSILQRCNKKNSESRLPIIEIGVGVSCQKGSPVFLFDGEHRIMISSAINHADRLSGCSKTIRKQIKKNKYYNLFVFQNKTDDAIAETTDDLFLRYNVNGIELGAGGFEKLIREIDLKPVHLKPGNDQNKTVRLYSGKYPTVSGKFKTLIIRESNISKIRNDTLEQDGFSKRKYYEVCSNPKLYEYAFRTDHV